MAKARIDKFSRSLPVAVMISGRGSNLSSLLSACRRADFPATIKLVISNNPDAGGLEHARHHNIPEEVIDHRHFATGEDFDIALDQCLALHGIELVCLAGFMRLLGTRFTQKWKNRLINIHPSLLPAFKGLNTHQRVLQSGVRISGCTTHYVRDDMDGGPIIMQAAVPVHPEDTPATLAGRILACEHKIYPTTLRLIAEKRITIHDEKVLIDGLAQPTASLIYPPIDNADPPPRRG